MLCTYCHTQEPAVGYCCKEAELATLRIVADEAIEMLDAETREQQTIGSIDAVVPMQLVARKLLAARCRRAAVG